LRQKSSRTKVLVTLICKGRRQRDDSRCAFACGNAWFSIFPRSKEAMDIFHVRCRLDQPRGVAIHLVPEDMLQFLMGVAANTFFSNVGLRDSSNFLLVTATARRKDFSLSSLTVASTNLFHTKRIVRHEYVNMENQNVVKRVVPIRPLRNLSFKIQIPNHLEKL
jgi:hypothetical protein